ncbi:MAG: flavodoxin family protein [Labilithrix sp.]
MTRVAVVYHSHTGRTRALAEAVARGAGGAEALSVDTPDLLAKLSAADAIVFGCPTYMGSASAGFKAFMDSTSAIWAVQGWRDKLAAAFTHSAAPSGDKLGTLTQLAVFAAQHGMVWVGLGLPPTYIDAGATTDTNRLGSHLGAMAQSRPGGALPESDLRTAELLGQRVLAAARRWVEGAPRDAIVSAEPPRHAAAQYWVFPSVERAPLPAGVTRTNLRELVARPERFEHHLVVCASIGAAQLEITAASEPLYFAHINLSDEVVVALPTGDDIVDRFPLRTFLARPDGTDAGRYNHRNGDALLHPQGWLHWPGRLRAPYAPFDFPPGMRRSGLSVVYCASALTRGRGSVREAPEGRAGDVKVYTEPAPPMMLSELKTPGRVGAIGKSYLDLVVRPSEIGLRKGGFVVVLEGSEPVFPCDLYRLAPGARLDGAGIVRALVFASEELEADPVPPSWTSVPAPAFAPVEEAERGTLPVDAGNLHISEGNEGLVNVTVEEEKTTASAAVPRYWLARMLYRLGLHGYRLGYVETYEGFFVDDRGDGPVRIGLRKPELPHQPVSVAVPREAAPALIERLYRAVAPANYVERLR